jgi:hypothetical protein
MSGRCGAGATRSAHFTTQFSRFTSTKVQILTRIDNQKKTGARLLPEQKTNLENFLAGIFTTSGTLNLHWMRDNRKINRCRGFTAYVSICQHICMNLHWMRDHRKIKRCTGLLAQKYLLDSTNVQILTVVQKYKY